MGAYCRACSRNTAVHVLFGNGAFGFQDTTPYSGPNGFSISSGDLNSDGRTDLFGYDNSTNQLTILYGQTDKTFTTYNYSGFNGYGGVGSLSMADFNGDGRMDLVAFNSGYSTTSGTFFRLVFFLAGANPGEFTSQTYTLPYFTSYTGAVVGNFSVNNKPDVAVVQGPEPSGTGPSTISTAINQTSGYYGGCAYPKLGQGISLCTPAGTSSTSPVSFNAAANSFGDIRKFELYIDGKKISEQHHSWGHNAYFDLSTPLAVGKHQITLNFTTIDNDAMEYYKTLTVTK